MSCHQSCRHRWCPSLKMVLNSFSLFVGVFASKPSRDIPHFSKSWKILALGNQKHHVKCDVASRIIETVVRLEVWLRNQGSPRALEYTAVGKS